MNVQSNQLRRKIEQDVCRNKELVNFFFSLCFLFSDFISRTFILQAPDQCYYILQVTGGSD